MYSLYRLYVHVTMLRTANTILTLLFVIWALNIKPCLIFRVWFGYVEILRISHLIIQIYVFVCLLSTFLLLIFSPSLLNFRVFWNIFFPLLVLFMELEETEYVLPGLPQFMFEHDVMARPELGYYQTHTRPRTDCRTPGVAVWRAQHRFGSVSSSRGQSAVFTLQWRFKF